MKRLIVMATVLAALAPVGYVAADFDRLDFTAGGMQPAARVGNPTATDEPAPPPKPPAPVGSTYSAELQQMLDLVNVERTSRGLSPLRLEARLNEAAKLHSADQAARGTIFHIASDGSNPGDRIERQGYQFSHWGENVAAGFRNPATVIVAWMNSPGHCKNILNPSFTELGVGHVQNLNDPSRYKDYWTQVFGRPFGQERPSGTYNSAWC
jgi:uncharacterized protein YkwD